VIIAKLKKPGVKSAIFKCFLSDLTSKLCMEIGDSDDVCMKSYLYFAACVGRY